MRILWKLSEISFRKFGLKAVGCKFKCIHDSLTQEKKQNSFGQWIVDEHSEQYTVRDLFSNEGVWHPTYDFSAAISGITCKHGLGQEGFLFYKFTTSRVFS